MKYLIRDKGKIKAYHIWTGDDTACRMWSTGGMQKKKGYTLHDETMGLRLCCMCENNERSKGLALNKKGTHSQRLPSLSIAF